jgi:hypothetical protein
VPLPPPITSLQSAIVHTVTAVSTVGSLPTRLRRVTNRTYSGILLRDHETQPEFRAPLVERHGQDDMSESETGSIGDTARSASPESADVTPRIFGLLIERIEQLARELGRNEGRQIALEQQIARLETQMATLQRGSSLD